MDYNNKAEKQDLLNKISYELEEDLSSLIRISINNNPVEGILARFFVMKVVLEYCENQEKSLIEQKSELNLSSQDIISLISDISLKKRLEVVNYYSGTLNPNNHSSEVIENDISNENIHNVNNFTEDFLIDSYEEEIEFLENHIKEPFPEFIEEDNFERNYTDEVNQDNCSGSLLDDLNEHICINELFYKFCYSSEIFNLYLMERESREALSKEVSSEIEWPIDEESITYSYFKEFLQNKGLHLVDYNEFPSSFFYNEVFFEFNTKFHFLEDNRLFEKFVIEGNYIDNIEHIHFPVAKAFVVFIKNNIPYSIFNILFEPIIMKFTLNKIYKNGAPKIICIGDSLDEVFEMLEDRCCNDENDPIFLF